MTEKTEAATYTAKAASLRHRGMTVLEINRMCCRGRNLLKHYGNRESVPDDKTGKALFGHKVGRTWNIPATELDRLFLAS